MTASVLRAPGEPLECFVHDTPERSPGDRSPSSVTHSLGSMDKDEEEQTAAEELASNLASLGWQRGVGAGVWARVAQDALALHEQARSTFGSGARPEDWERFYGSAYVAVVAIDQVLAFERRVRKLSGDAELQKARKLFDAQGPKAESLRDLVAHLDEYAVGKGQRQVGRRNPPIADDQLSPLVYWTDTGRTYVTLGGEQVDLHAIVDAGVELAEVVERVREKHLRRASERANAALRRRFSLPG